MTRVAYDPQRHHPPPEQCGGHLFHYITGWCDQCGQGIQSVLFGEYPRCDPTVSPITQRTGPRVAFQKMIAEIVDKL